MVDSCEHSNQHSGFFMNLVMQLHNYIIISSWKITLQHVVTQIFDISRRCSTILSQKPRKAGRSSYWLLPGISNEKRTHRVSPCFSKEKIRRNKFFRHQLYHLILRVLEIVFFIFILKDAKIKRPLWSSDQSSWLQIQRSRVRFPALLCFLRNNGPGTWSTQPREDNWGATWMKK
jgi:hypothetical protein